ncbi:MAG: DNA replication and repair protein RecF [Rubricoccaceae bacterium]|nr:DNA replication and repair protein RecF [Rubricoccaceae bacterium]
MRLERVELTSFRSHTGTALELAPKINLLCGENGAGKTNVLEAIHCLCLSKSFLTSTDSNILQRGASFYEVEGVFTGSRRASLKARLIYVPAEGKRILLNGAALERMADIVGELPVVAISPGDITLTAGGPEERRRFLDATLCQAYPVYLDDLMKYRRTLRQRNILLLQEKRGGWVDTAALAAWSEELVALGARIIARRKEFIGQFAQFLAEAYALLDDVGDEPSMEYVTVGEIGETGEVSSADAIADVFRDRLASLGRNERKKGRTLAGPHLDEVVFRLGDFEVRPYASQGQHRIVGLAVRLATVLYLNARLDEMPILLLDDVFGTLDRRRAGIVVDLLKSDAVGQSVVTAARPEVLSDYISFDSAKHSVFTLEGGMLNGRGQIRGVSEEQAV